MVINPTMKIYFVCEHALLLYLIDFLTRKLGSLVFVSQGKNVINTKMKSWEIKKGHNNLAQGHSSTVLSTTNTSYPLETSLDSSWMRVTIPVPMVDPDSRIVNLWPASMGIPVSDMDLMSIVTLSPGITISMSSGRST